MFKKINLLAAMLFCVVLFVGCSKANAQAGGKPASESDFEVTLTEDNSGVVITKYVGKGGNVVIPDTIQGLPVKEIDFMAFSGNKNLKSVVIPNSVTKLGGFRGCINLVSVKLPENDNLVINPTAFQETGLKSVTFYGNVEFLESGAYGTVLAFYECNKLETFVFESGVKVVKTDGGFVLPKNFKEIVFKSPDTVISSERYRDLVERSFITAKMPLAMQQEIKNRIVIE